MRPKNIGLHEFQYVVFAIARESMTWEEPIPPFETRFTDRLESCLATPFMRYNRKDLYRGLLGKASIFFYLLIKSHPFQNGNKRVAIIGTLYFLHKNGYWLAITNEDLYEFARNVAGSHRTHKDQMIDVIHATLEQFLVKK
jgi:death on curing protein